MKNWIIKGKGYFNTGVSHPYSINSEISDIKYTYGEITFKGTKKAFNKFVESVMEDESTFKVIDYFEKDSKEHRIYKYGINDMFHPKNLKK